MNASESQSKIAPALAKAQSQFKSVQKGGENTFDRYRYATLEDDVAAVGHVLADHGLCLLSSVEEVLPLEDRKTAKGGTEHAVRVRLSVRVLHESGEWVEATVWGEGQDRADKAVYKAITGARKYGLAAALNLATTDDPEQDEGDQRPRQPQQQQRPPANGNGQPKPAAAAGTPDLADDGAFRQAMMKEFTARTFTPEQMTAAAAAIAKHFGAANPGGIPADKRAAVIASIAKGLADKFKRPPKPTGPATPEQVTEVNDLLAIVGPGLPDGTVERWLGAASVESFEEMPADKLAACIDALKKMLPTPATAGKAA